MKEKILNLLKENRDDYISGQHLSEILGVSRTAIWKAIKNLKLDGYIIESVSRKGYRLINSPDLLTYSEIKDRLNTYIIGRRIINFESIDSTNNEAKKLAGMGEEEGTVVISEEQVSGKGRLGRTWVSPKGKGIWMSIILRPDIDPIYASKITMIGAASVYSSIRELGLNPYIKWPNDIVLNDKKVSGILTEMSGELSKINYIVMGIGINVNFELDEFNDEIKDKATSLKIEGGVKVSRKDLVASILNNFEKFYLELINDNTIKKAMVICREGSILVGKKVKILTRNKEEECKVLDITDDGELVVEDNNGVVKKVISGEVSVRGLYGYV